MDTKDIVSGAESRRDKHGIIGMIDAASVRLGLIGGLIASLAAIVAFIMLLSGSASAASSIAGYGRFLLPAGLAFVAISFWLRYRTGGLNDMATQETVLSIASSLGLAFFIYIIFAHAVVPVAIGGASAHVVGNEAADNAHVGDSGSVDVLAEASDGSVAVSPDDPPDEIINDTANVVNSSLNGITDGGWVLVNETATGDEANDINETNETANDTIAQANATEIQRPPKSEYLQRFRVLLGGKTAAASCYIAEDTWIRLDGVILADVDFSDKIGTVIYADWKVSEEEILESTSNRFSTNVKSRDTCTYKLNFESYCCDGKCYYLKGLRDELS